METDNEHSCATIDTIETYSGPKIYLDSTYKSLNVIALKNKIWKSGIYEEGQHKYTFF